MNLTEIAEQPVGRIVAQYPRAARVFEKYQIDYCCQGRANLRVACQNQNVNLDKILDELAVETDEKAGSDEVNPSEMGPAELVDHIVETHHEFLRKELPRLSELIAKVRNAHGASHPELESIDGTFHGMRTELESHMLKEEQILFPAVKSLATSGHSTLFPFGSVESPITVMEQEHDHAGDALKKLRELTADFTPPADACPTYRVLYASLSELEQDMHQHIHKENNILFPEAIRMESCQATRSI